MSRTRGHDLRRYAGHKRHLETLARRRDARGSADDLTSDAPRAHDRRMPKIEGHDPEECDACFTLGDWPLVVKVDDWLKAHADAGRPVRIEGQRVVEVPQ